MKKLLLTLVFMIIAINANAKHPLISEDTGTQGKGRFQFEINGGWGRDTYDGTVDSGEVCTALVSGVAEKLDFVVWFPLLIEKPEGAKAESGISDINLEMKWNFYGTGIVNFAVKPGVVLPSGDESRGFGGGEIRYQCFFVTTIEPEPFAMHLNAIYIRNENSFEERKDLWHFCASIEYFIIENLSISANAGIQRNSDPACDVHPACVLAGIIWSPDEDLDIDFGYKIGLNEPETDHALVAGVTVRW